MNKAVISVISGIFLGFLASKIHIQGFTLIPWGLAAIILGYYSNNRKEATINGASYGFLLGFVFMIAAYNGSDPLINKIPFFILMGIFSAICAMVLTIIGYFVKSKIKKN